MAELQLISSDSHVSEPPDLWVERIDTKYRDRAPRVVLNPEGQEGAYLVYEGYPPHNLAIGLGAGRTPEELAAFLKTGTYADARPGGWDPAQRLPDMELDGVEAEVLYTTLGFRLFWLKDAGLQRACFRVYNDWLAAYCSYAPRLPTSPTAWRSTIRSGPRRRTWTCLSVSTPSPAWSAFRGNTVPKNAPCAQRLPPTKSRNPLASSSSPACWNGSHA